jgi:sugar phosphate isomerase/epimerase
MEPNRISSLSRRRVLSGAVAAAATLGWLENVKAADELIKPSDPKAPADPWRGLKMGLASYSLRGLKLGDAIKAINRVQLRFVSIKDIHLKMTATTEERKAVAQQFRDAGIEPISCGVVAMENEAAARQAFEYAKDIAVPVIVCNPKPELMPLLDELVKAHDLRLAIHNHGPEDKRYAGPYDAMKVIEKFDPRIGLCVDVGHTARAGNDPAEAIKKLRDRVFDIHLKDVADLAQRGSECECGRGVLNVRAILQALLDISYQHHVGLEHERDARDPIPGVAESVGYCKGMLKAMA